MFKVKPFGIFGSNKRDPAPSRIAYLSQRLWLRKYFRFFIFSLCTSVLCFFSFVFLQSKTNFFLDTKVGMARLVKEFTSSPALKITKMHIISENATLVSSIESALTIEFPISSLDLDVETLRDKVENISAIKSAAVRLTASGLLEIEVAQRKSVAVHQINGRFEVLDIDGVTIGSIDKRTDRSDLPLIVGFGANHEVSEALTLLIESSYIIDRISGLSRVGTRRWDIILDRGQVIKLPEYDPLRAVQKVVSLHKVHRVLDRDVSYLDFRDISRPMIGLTRDSTEQLKEIRDILRGESV